MKRRDFVRTSLGAATLASISTKAYARTSEAKKRVALIGAGWYGKCDLLQLLNVSPVEVVSLCDVDSRMLAEAADLFQSRQVSGNRPQTYGDYRKLLAEQDFDIVLVDTPDHWHALPMIAAVEAGADVWVQKPTAVTVLESKAMVDAARKHNRVVQVGTQRRSTPHLIEAKQKVIDAGLLGDIAHAEVYCYYHMRARKNPPVIPVPDTLDYEMWTGPAPMRPFTELIHPRSWRAFTEYGNGIVGDMCVHMLDLVRWALDLPWPKRISSSGGILVQTDSAANISDTQTATFEFEDLDVCWAHRSWGTSPDPEYPWGATIYGSKGTLKMSVQKYDFIPQGGGEKLHGEAVVETDKYPTDVTDSEKWSMELQVASAIRGHLRNFLDCIESRQRPVADIEQGHISSSACFLANNAMALNRTLDWDPETHQVINDPEANQLLAREYRKPWQNPGLFQ